MTMEDETNDVDDKNIGNEKYIIKEDLMGK